MARNIDSEDSGLDASSELDSGAYGFLFNIWSVYIAVSYRIGISMWDALDAL